MKKFLALLLVFLMLTLTFTGCSESNVTSNSDVSSNVSSEEEVSSEPVSSEEESSEPEETIEEPVEEPEYDFGYEEEEEINEEPLTPEQQRLENILAGTDAELNKDALYKEGNLARIAKVINKSKSGKEVVFVFYGNASNTARNSDVGGADVCYFDVFAEWWAANIGPCTVYNAGSDNLTSINACMRVEHDVLRRKPDMVFLDFAVQDAVFSQAKTNALGYDNLIRRILHSETAPAVVSLMLTGAEQQTFTMNPNNANIFPSAAKEQKQVAEYYNLPIIDFEQAFWDNSVELVEVTTKKETPLLNWNNISLDNTIMNNDGHKILCGTLTYFIETVRAKLNKISTKAYNYPTTGFYGNDKYMKGSFISIDDILAADKGYSFDLKTSIELNREEYNYTPESKSDSTTPYIKTYRHYVPSENPTEEELKYVANGTPHYLEMELPKVDVNKQEVYFMLHTTKGVANRMTSSSPLYNYSPVSIICYDENGEQIGSPVKPTVGTGNYTETSNLGKTSTIKLPADTTKIVFRIYTTQGTVRLFGVGIFDK